MDHDMDLYSLPVWSDCPFRNAVPAHLQIRRFDVDGQTFVDLWDDEYEVGATLRLRPDIERHLPPVLARLAKDRATKASALH